MKAHAPHTHGPHPPPPRVDDACEPRMVGIAHTLEHCARVLPPAPARLVEMGAGDGLLAAALAARGYDVLAVDENPEMVEAARARGVHAVCADAVRFQAAAPFDVALYTRSLHHMFPLEGALDRAAALLRPGGVLMVEDFAWESLDRDTARWIVDMFAVCEAAGVVREPWLEGLDVDGFVARWRREYGEEHGLHTGEALLGAIRPRFSLVEVAPTSYFYRYLCWRLEQSDTGRRVAQAAFEAEARHVLKGHLRGIGLRITARRPS